LAERSKANEMSTKDNVKSLFSGRATEWAGWYADDRRPTLEADNLLARRRLAGEMIAAAVGPPARILDVGCGTGDMAGWLMKRGYRVAGVDIAEPMVLRARERWPEGQFEVGDGERLPFDNASFDAVVCLGVIEYLDADGRALAEIRRVLKPGGAAVISTPSCISPLYHLDRLVLIAEEAAKPLFYAAKYRLRGRRVPPEPPSADVTIRRYRRGPWLRLLRSAGLEPEDWVCHGWGWYRSRLGRVATGLSRLGHGMRRAVTQLAGERTTSRAIGLTIRHPALNWIGAEQIVRVRVVKQAARTDPPNRQR
jgi:ubiquinone/menaquinone biosynthesis C-methylase UbiE